MSSPFDIQSADFLLKDLKMKIVKVPSGEITNTPLLQHLAQFHRPIILSTGMSTLDEIQEAIQSILEIHPQCELTLLHCTSNYPCPFGDVNLAAMKTIADKFNFPIGYSDHTIGIEVSLAAVALGASIIEKHFTSDQSLDGPDHVCSLSPQQLRLLVTSIRNIELSIGSSEKKPTQAELEVRQKVRKSLVMKASLNAGHILSIQDIDSKRPGTGIPPSQINQVIGKELAINKSANDLISWDDIK